MSKKRYRKFTVQTDMIHPETGEKILDEATINEVLTSKKLKKWAYILHDKDKTVDDEGNEIKRAAHWHIVLWLENASTHSAVGKWFGLNENFVEHIKSDWGAMITYLTHELEDEKYRYPDTDVVANFDWEQERNDYLEYRSEHITKEELDMFYRRCARGDIREYDHHKHIPALIYIKNEKLFKTAFDYFMTKVAPKNRVPKRILFLSGVSGAGKTRLAQELAEQQDEKPFISSAGSDVMDGYQGERIVIFDDFRGENWTVEQLLKLTDPYADSKTWSRYKSKSLAAADTIIFTFRSHKEMKVVERFIQTPPELKEFFELFRGSESEPLRQWTRRVEVFVRIVNRQLNSTENLRTSYFYAKINDDEPEKGWELRGTKEDIYKTLVEQLNTDDWLKTMGVNVVPRVPLSDTYKDEIEEETGIKVPF